MKLNYSTAVELKYGVQWVGGLVGLLWDSDWKIIDFGLRICIPFYEYKEQPWVDMPTNMFDDLLVSFMENLMIAKFMHTKFRMEYRVAKVLNAI